MARIGFRFVLLMAVLGACAPVTGTSGPPGPALPPAEAPAHTPGDTLVMRNLDTGTVETARVLSVSGRIVSGVSEPEGCAWTNREDGYGPSLSWRNCGAPAAPDRWSAKATSTP